MKILSATLLFVIFGCAFAASTHQKLRTSSRQIDDLRTKIEEAGGCNANVCFALDGSGSVTDGQFNNQKNFVFDVVNAIAGNPLEAAAVQYGLINRPISFLTPDIESFFLDLDDAIFADDPRTSVGGGIVWCHRQLRKRPGEANKIVVFSDGRNNLGGSPARRANRFRKSGGKVAVVGVGFNRHIRKLLRIAGGNPDLVLTVQDYLELADLIEELVEQICEIEFL